MVRYFMTIPEAVQLVIQAGALGHSGKVFLLDMGQPVNILELARDLIRLSGLVPYRDIPIHITGARPGERLHEEMLTREEGVAVTQHERIFVAPATALDPDRVERLAADLLDAAAADDRGALLAALQALLPSYQPSPFLAASLAPQQRGTDDGLETDEQLPASPLPANVPCLDLPPKAA
jgi:FlaA1/EpsC-like NDP-sugar epimerase